LFTFKLKCSLPTNHVIVIILFGLLVLIKFNHLIIADLYRHIIDSKLAVILYWKLKCSFNRRLIITVDVGQLHIEVGEASIDCALNRDISQRNQCLVSLIGGWVLRPVPQRHLVTSLVGSDVVHFTTTLLSNKFLAFYRKGDFVEPFRGLVYTCFDKPGFGLCSD
jgi:hypothetical protein